MKRNKSSCRQLKLPSPDGKKYNTDCANSEGIFRIIQSIPSPKAEPFKRWLAKVGKVTAEIAKSFAENDFDNYRPIQDRLFESDFDKEIKKLLDI